MIVGVPREIKDHESRVGITPAGVKALCEAGHTVLVQTQAGEESGFPDEIYQNAGAEIGCAEEQRRTSGTLGAIAQCALRLVT